MRGAFPIARVFGIPILVNASWFVSLTLVVSVLSMQIFPDFFPGRNGALYWSLGLAGGLIFFASIVLHELGHSVVARRYGIPVKSITLFIFGGVAQITREAPGPQAELLMAFAGPFVSLLLGGLFLGVKLLLLPGDTPVSVLAEWLGVMNLVVAVFNLLPGFPMDGGRLFRSLLWAISGNYRASTRVAGWLGRILAVGIIGAGLLTFLRLPGWPLGNDPFGGVWLIVVGLFLNYAAGQTQEQTRLLDVLTRYRAEQVMDASAAAVPAEATVRQLVYELPAVRAQSVCFVLRDGRLVGLLARDRVLRTPAEDWARLTAADLMIAAEQIQPAQPEENLATLLQRMEADELPGVPVVRQGVVLGIVTRAGLGSLLRRQPGLEPAG